MGFEERAFYERRLRQGEAAIGASVIGMITWLVAALPTQEQTGVDIWPLLAVFGVIAVLGGYVIVAAETKRGWLPGRKAMEAERRGRFSLHPVGASHEARVGGQAEELILRATVQNGSHMAYFSVELARLDGFTSGLTDTAPRLYWMDRPEDPILIPPNTCRDIAVGVLNRDSAGWTFTPSEMRGLRPSGVKNYRFGSGPAVAAITVWVPNPDVNYSITFGVQMTPHDSEPPGVGIVAGTATAP